MKAKRVFAVLLALSMAAVFGACSTTDTGSSTTSTPSSKTESSKATGPKPTELSAVAPDDNAGFTEIPIDETDVQGAPLHLAAVYFQPVQMEGNQNIGTEGYNIHLEADISATENELGFGVGDWVPYMTVDYKVEGSDNKVAASGTFMVMNADDGPHYGANIKLDKSDTYKLTFTLHSPVENGFLLHTDDETGVKGRFWDEPVTVTFENWEYTVTEW